MPGLGGLGEEVFPEETWATQTLCSPSLEEGAGHLPLFSRLVIRISPGLQRTHGLVSTSHFKLNEIINKSNNKLTY